MIHIVIVEDCVEERERMIRYVKDYCAGHDLSLDLSVYSDGKYLLDDYPKNPDLLLLDIDMEILSGIETARKIRSFDSGVQILFVTRMVQFALEGYEVDAADFIVKPIPFPLFCARMDRVMKRILRGRPRFLQVIADRETKTLRVQQIICIEASNKRTLVHMANGDVITVSEALYSLEKKLIHEPFFRCHNAFLVNFDFVQSFSANDVILPDMIVPVSKHRKKDFLQALAKYRGQIL